jgi:hypothetical protein
MTGQHEDLSAAEERLREAEVDLDRRQLVAELCKKEGLAYASLTDDQLGPMLVTYQHQPIGELHTTSPSALRDWHAQAYRSDGSLGESSGPYVTARAAAAALIPGHAKEEPGTSGAG